MVCTPRAVVKFLFVLLLTSYVMTYSHPTKSETAIFTNEIDNNRMLVVITAPSSSDNYYKDVYNKILKYDIEYAKNIIGKDNIVVLGDKKAISILKKHLPDDILLQADMRDIWMRDFTTVNTYNPLQFRYAKAAQGGSNFDAQWVQKGFNRFAEKHDLQFRKTNLIMDGGNLVDNNKDSVIVTERFLQDNNLTYEKGKNALGELLDVKYIAIIPADDEEGLAHADGMAMFIDDNILAINKYDEPFRTKVLNELKQSLPGKKVIEIETRFDEDVWDESFSSACGIYTNSLVTENYIYMPIFGSDLDKKAIKLVQNNTTKKVVPIDASSVCFMGGSVRCLGWQVAGENAATIIEAARTK